MSALLQLADQAQHLVLAAADPLANTTVLAGGIIDRANSTATKLVATLQVVGGVAATVVALAAGWRAKGGVAGTAMGLVVAVLYFWGITNVTDTGIGQMLENDLIGAGHHSTVHVPGDATAIG
jgi:hypothetical protein